MIDLIGIISEMQRRIILMNDLVNLIVNNGIAVVVVAYFLFRDYKYNATMVLLLNDIKMICEDLKNMQRKDCD